VIFCNYAELSKTFLLRHQVNTVTKSTKRSMRLVVLFGFLLILFFFFPLLFLLVIVLSVPLTCYGCVTPLVSVLIIIYSFLAYHMDSKEVIVSMAITEIFDFWDMRSKRDNEKKKNNINKKPNKTTSLILRLVDFVTVCPCDMLKSYI
jgi:hypothetical protein